MVKLGIIGLGNIGTAHMKNILDGKTPEIQLSAIADRNEERRRWAKEQLSEDIAIFSDGYELMDSGLCNAILIAVPHYQHPELTIMGFQKGLHVMCEKPAGVYTKQVREMNQCAQQTDCVFGMMFNQRTNPLYRKMHELAHSGELGAIKRVNWIITDWYRTQFYYDSGDWRATWMGEGGGVLLNQCPHNLDLLQWICGMPVKVHAICHEGKWHHIEVEDDVTAYMEFSNGATGVFITSTADTPGTNRFEITFELGKLVCEHQTLTLYRLHQNERQFCFEASEGFAAPDYEKILLTPEGDNSQHVGVLNAFAACILRGESLVADGCEGINGLMLSNAMHLSSWLEKTINLPVDEELFLEKLNQRRAHSQKKTNIQSTFSDTSNSY